MADTYRETIAGIDLVAKGDRLTLRRSRASAFQMVVPFGMMGYIALIAIRLVRAIFHAAWTSTAWLILVLLTTLVCAVFYVFNRRKLTILRDGTVRQGKKVKAFGPGLRVSAQTQPNKATLLAGESPSNPLEKLADTPFFTVPLEAEWIAVCVNDFLGHPRLDGAVEYPRPVS